MQNLVVISLGLILLTALLVWIVIQQRRNMLLQRLTFGFEAPVEEIQEDLSAGDYGLKGYDRFIYNLRLFLTSAQGKFIIFLVGGLVGFAAGYLAGVSLGRLFLTGLSGGGILWLLTMAMLSLQHNKQQRRIKSELPNALEMMAAIMEGGLAFEASLGHVLRESDKKHPLYFDLGVMNEAMQRGRRRSEALRLWAERCNLIEVQEVSAAMVQAEQTGSSLAEVMRHHAVAQLRELEAEIQRRAERLPLKMIFPMLFTIMPAIFIVGAVPSLLKVFRMFEALMANVR